MPTKLSKRVLKLACNTEISGSKHWNFQWKCLYLVRHVAITPWSELRALSRKISCCLWKLTNLSWWYCLQQNHQTRNLIKVHGWDPGDLYASLPIQEGCTCIVLTSRVPRCSHVLNISEHMCTTHLAAMVKVTVEAAMVLHTQSESRNMHQLRACVTIQVRPNTQTFARCRLSRR